MPLRIHEGILYGAGSAIDLLTGAEIGPGVPQHLSGTSVDGRAWREAQDPDIGVGLSSEWVLAFERFDAAEPDGQVAQFVAVERSTGELVPLPVLGDPQYEMCC